MKLKTIAALGLSVAALRATLPSADAQDLTRRANRKVASTAGPDGRPLTIGGRRGPSAGGIVVRDGGNEIYAPGGFSAHGYGWGPPGSDQAQRAARNASVTYRSANSYLGLNGIGAYGFGDRGESGYNNPYYGNSYNRYVGYNGTPADLAFGPAFANRHITADDEDFERSEGLTSVDRDYTRPLFSEDE